VLVAVGLFMARELMPPRSLRSLPPEGAFAADRQSRIRARPWLGRLRQRIRWLRGTEH